MRALCAWRWSRRARVVMGALLLALLSLLLAAPAGWGDVYSNIAPASQVPAGGWYGRFPLANYALDQYFPGVKVSLLGGVDVSGVPPLIAFFMAQVIWQLTSFLANALITLFAFAFSLDLLNGSDGAGGALAPVSDAIHNLYASTFGGPWLIVAILLAGVWAMWKALVQRRYTETAGALAISVLYCVLALGIVTQPQRTIAPVSRLTNSLSASLLSLTSHGSVQGSGQVKQAAANQLFSLLILEPWTVLEFGGVEHCVSNKGDGTQTVPVRPLSASPSRDVQLAQQLQAGAQVSADGKTCINDRQKYAPHFLAYPFQSPERNAEHDALEHADTQRLPDSDPGKHNGAYPLGAADKSAVEAMGKGGQYERLLLAIVIAAGELGAFLLLGALCVAVLLSQILLLLLLAFAPVALIVGIFPGRGHDFFTGWLTRMATLLARKVIYSLILAVVLTVCAALDSATSNLGWLLSFALQAGFLWTVFLQRHRLAGDLLAATVGPGSRGEPTARLQSLYYGLRLARMVKPRREQSTSQRRPPDSGDRDQEHPLPSGDPSPLDSEEPSA